MTRHATTLLLSLLLLLGMFCGTLAFRRISPAATAAANSHIEQLFEITNIWTVHLKFRSDQWEAMEPKGGFGPDGGPGRPGGPGMPGPGGPHGFGPGMLLAPAFLKAGDLDHDNRLSRGEFLGLAEKWFTAWDTNGSGSLDVSKTRTGLNALIGPGFAPPGFGPPRGPGLGNRGPDEGGPGMALQGRDGKRNGLAAAMGVEFTYVQADLEFQGYPLEKVWVRYKGNNTFMSSRGSLKRPLKVDLNRGWPGRKLGGVTKLNLHNNVNDPSWMNEVLSHRLFRDAGVPAPRTAYARVYVTVPGKYENQYLGLYSLVENVDNDFLRARYGTKRGALFKPTTRQLFENLGDKWVAYQRTYNPKTPVLEEQAQRVIDFSKLVSNASDAEFAARLEEFLDLDEFARFMAVTVWLSTMDSILSMGQNFLVYLHPKTMQFQFIPWDLDHSFGQFPMAGSQEQLENLSIQKPWSGRVLFLERVFKVQKFKQLYLAKLQEFADTIFQPERLQEQVDQLGIVLRPAIQRESAEKLAGFDKVVAGESVEGMGFGGAGPASRPESRMRAGPGFGPPGGFGQARKPIKGFVTARAKSVSGQLAGNVEGTILSGPGGPGGPPGRGGPRGGPGAFGPGNLLAPALFEALDSNKDGRLTREEFVSGFSRWFDTWADKSGFLSEEQLRAGINSDLAPFRGGPPPGFGPPPDMLEPPDDLDEL